MVLKSMNKPGIACLFSGIMMLSSGGSSAEGAPAKVDAPASQALEKEKVAVTSPAPWFGNAGKHFKVDTFVNLTAGYIPPVVCHRASSRVRGVQQPLSPVRTEQPVKIP